MKKEYRRRSHGQPGLIRISGSIPFSLGHRFGKQWLLLGQHFLLVLSTLGYTFLIGLLSNRLNIRTAGILDPILDAADVGIVSLFCVEAIARLAIIAWKETRDDIRP